MGCPPLGPFFMSAYPASYATPRSRCWCRSRPRGSTTARQSPGVHVSAGPGCRLRLKRRLSRAWPWHHPLTAEFVEHPQIAGPIAGLGHVGLDPLRLPGRRGTSRTPIQSQMKPPIKAHMATPSTLPHHPDDDQHANNERPQSGQQGPVQAMQGFRHRSPTIARATFSSSPAYPQTQLRQISSAKHLQGSRVMQLL